MNCRVVEKHKPHCQASRRRVHNTGSPGVLMLEQSAPRVSPPPRGLSHQRPPHPCAEAAQLFWVREHRGGQPPGGAAAAAGLSAPLGGRVPRGWVPVRPGLVPLPGCVAPCTYGAYLTTDRLLSDTLPLPILGRLVACFGSRAEGGRIAILLG